MLSTIKSLVGSSSTLLLHKRIFLKDFRKKSESVKGGLVEDPTVAPSLVRGLDFLTKPRLYKGLGFTMEERQTLGIHGLLAPGYKTLEEQLQMCKISISRYKNDLNKYLYLAELHDLNERLFFNLLASDIEAYMPIVYTPVVGKACQRFGLVYRRPKGLFVSINDKGHILSVLKNWPIDDIRAICFTDGERILGLGDLGAYGMGIPIGKMALYTALAGIKPHQCLPITLDVGTNTEKLWEDPFYIGLRKKRVTGEEYQEFIAEFLEACVLRFGSQVLLQFEDFALANAIGLLATYKEHYCTFNDDIQGTAAVALAGLIAALRITKKQMKDNILMFLGAGSASTGIADLIVEFLVEEGVSKKEAYKRIYMFDIDGLLAQKRKAGVPGHAKQYTHDIEPSDNFEECVAKYKPSILIGCSTLGGAFTTNILKQMAKNAERPIVFALSNPTVKAECTPQEAYDHTEGRVVYASGSPFKPVKYKGKTYRTGQGNNSYIFPGVALGIIATKSCIAPDSFFLQAAKVLADKVTEDDLKDGRVYPPVAQCATVSFDIAVEVANMAHELGLARAFPKPRDMAGCIKTKLYNLKYPSVLPLIYDFPIPPLKKGKGKKC